jgi:hypothetical protein
VAGRPVRAARMRKAPAAIMAWRALTRFQRPSGMMRSRGSSCVTHCERFLDQQIHALGTIRRPTLPARTPPSHPADVASIPVPAGVLTSEAA